MSPPITRSPGRAPGRAAVELSLAYEKRLVVTFLDLAHQIEVLDLVAELNETDGRTVVAVLHDLNLACRYAHHVIAMKEGAVEAEGPPAEVITAELVERVFGLEAEVIFDPLAGTPLIVPVPRDKRHYP